MNKVIRFIQNYLVVGLPFVIFVMVWETLYPSIVDTSYHNFFAKIMWNLLCLNIGFWFAALILFLIVLVAMPSVREKTLARLANLKERDEREQYITGKASRAAYVATLSLTIFFLFFSMFSFVLSKNPQMEPGHQVRASIGVHFSFLNKNEIQHAMDRSPQEEVIFNSDDYRFSTSAMMIILLCWQLLSFNLVARKELVEK